MTDCPNALITGARRSVLAPGSRLHSVFEAANGIITFGWTTAVVMAVV
jgi:hypothetical protein